MFLYKTFTPEQVLKALAHYIHEGLPEDKKDLNITAAFVDDQGSVEVTLSTPRGETELSN